MAKDAQKVMRVLDDVEGTETVTLESDVEALVDTLASADELDDALDDFDTVDQFGA